MPKGTSCEGGRRARYGGGMEPPAPQAAVDRGARLLRVGAAFLVAWLGGYTLLALAVPEPYAQAWQLVLGQLVAGQAFVASLGPYLGFPGWFVVAQGALQAAIILMVLFPVLLLTRERSRKLRFLSKQVARVEALTERFHTRFGRWGVVALLVFLMFPLWNTGSGAVAVAGALLNLRVRTLLVTVILGTAVSLSLWVLAFDTLEAILAASGIEELPLPVPALVLIAVVVVAGAKAIVKRIRARV